MVEMSDMEPDTEPETEFVEDMKHTDGVGSAGYGNNNAVSRLD